MRNEEKSEVVNPADLLLPYQREFVENNSRFKLFMASRQIGKSFTLAFEAVRDCVLKPKSSWLAVSRGERQSQEWLKKARDLALVWCAYASKRGLHISYTSNLSQITFSNGSRILALPSRSDTIRGYSANVILDEFAYHEHPEELWEAIFPSISNELNAKYRLIIASTVAGKINKFWQLWEQKNAFWKIKVDIHRAVKEGLPVDIDELKASIGDDDAWRQEYECVPMSDSASLASVEMINRAQFRGRGFATTSVSTSALDDKNRKFYIGIDIGRKHDLTCIWVIETMPNGLLRTASILELRGVDFATQRATMSGFVGRAGVKRVCVDATGVGAQLGEELVTIHGSKVEACVWSAPFKNELWTAYSRAFQDSRLCIPSDTKERPLTNDLGSVQRHYTQAGNITYSAPTNADGHSDRASALALAIRATREYEMRGSSKIESRNMFGGKAWDNRLMKKIPTIYKDGVKVIRD